MKIQLNQTQKGKIKEIWLNKRNLKRAKDIFLEDLQEFFPNAKIKSAEWITFLRLIRDWKIEEKEKEAGRLAQTLSDEDILELQTINRKRTITLLSKLLEDYELHPRKLGRLDLSRLYQIIQTAEEAIKRTEIMKHKEKRETIRMFYPYQRLSLQEILKLKKLANDSFERILQLKQSPGPTE